MQPTDMGQIISADYAFPSYVTPTYQPRHPPDLHDSTPNSEGVQKWPHLKEVEPNQRERARRRKSVMGIERKINVAVPP